MCNLYTYKMTAEEMRALKLHFLFIGTTWTEWEERQRRQNEPIEDVYPNKRAPVVVIEASPSTSLAPTGAPTSAR